MALLVSVKDVKMTDLETGNVCFDISIYRLEQSFGLFSLLGAASGMFLRQSKLKGLELVVGTKGCYIECLLKLSKYQSSQENESLLLREGET